MKTNDSPKQSVRVGIDKDGRIAVGFGEKGPFFSFSPGEATALGLALIGHSARVYEGRETVTDAASNAPESPIVLPPLPRNLNSG